MCVDNELLILIIYFIIHDKKPGSKSKSILLGPVQHVGKRLVLNKQTETNTALPC